MVLGEASNTGLEKWRNGSVVKPVSGWTKAWLQSQPWGQLIRQKIILQVLSVNWAGRLLRLRLRSAGYLGPDNFQVQTRSNQISFGSHDFVLKYAFCDQL